MESSRKRNERGVDDDERRLLGDGEVSVLDGVLDGVWKAFMGFLFVSPLDASDGPWLALLVRQGATRFTSTGPLPQAVVVVAGDFCKN